MFLFLCVCTYIGAISVHFVRVGSLCAQGLCILKRFQGSALVYVGAGVLLAFYDASPWRSTDGSHEK